MQTLRRLIKIISLSVEVVSHHVHYRETSKLMIYEFMLENRCAKKGNVVFIYYIVLCVIVLGVIAFTSSRMFSYI